MLQLSVTNEEAAEVVAIQGFLSWKNVNFKTQFDPDTVKHLNQGKDTPLLMKDDMIVSRGFYDIVEHVKAEGILINE